MAVFYVLTAASCLHATRSRVRAYHHRQKGIYCFPVRGINLKFYTGVQRDDCMCKVEVRYPQAIRDIDFAMCKSVPKSLRYID